MKPWQIIPVPLPTAPSSTGPPAAFAIASWRCSGLTWKPLMSLSVPSQVSPTTGRLQNISSSPMSSTPAATSASRTTPTLCVFVSPIGVVRQPDSRIHSSPVSSPLPLRRWQPANSGSNPSRGITTVTPVRTGPLPRRSGPSPSISVTLPTRTPSTSVIASSGPGGERADLQAEVE